MTRELELTFDHGKLVGTIFHCKGENCCTKRYSADKLSLGGLLDKEEPVPEVLYKSRYSILRMDLFSALRRIPLFEDIT